MFAHVLQEKVCLGLSVYDCGKGKCKIDKHFTHCYHTVEGKPTHAIFKDYAFAKFL